MRRSGLSANRKFVRPPISRSRQKFEWTSGPWPRVSLAKCRLAVITRLMAVTLVASASQHAETSE